jgi:DNA-3-methyladenine glycosylase II
MKHTRARSGCSAELDLQGPLDVAASVEIFRRFGDDLLDRWDGEVLLRTVRTAGGESFAVAARPTGSIDAPRMHVTVADERHVDAATAAVRRWFVTVPPATLQALTRRDPVIRAAEQLQPGVRPVRQPDLLTALVRSISAQQINLRFAAVVRARLAERYGTRHEVEGREVWSLDPEPIAAAHAADLRALQFTTRKAESIIGIASACLGGSLDAEQLDALDDEQFIARLVTLRGIGRWTAEWLLARTLGRATVVAGDLGVRKAVGHAYCDGRMPGEDEVRELTRHWGDAAGVAQQLLLHVLLDNRWKELSSAAAGP